MVTFVRVAYSSATAEPALRLGIHDATRFEWVVSVPLPEHGTRPYVIEVEFEVPTSAVATRAPWDQLQTLTRLDSKSGAPATADTTTDALRRGTVALTQSLKYARLGFARHCHAAVGDPSMVRQHGGDGFLTVWLDAALRAACATRAKLTRSTPRDTDLILRERALIDEFVSVRLLEMLADADSALGQIDPFQFAADDPRAKAFECGRIALDLAVRDEIAYRQIRGFLRVDGSSAVELEHYVARTARLKRHFEEVLFLDRETHLVDRHVQQWTTVIAALLAGIVAFGVQTALPLASHVTSGLVLLALITGATYAVRDRVKEAMRGWLTGKMYPYHAQRASRWRVPPQRMRTDADVLRAREWMHQTTRTDPDPLNPEAGASLPTTVVAYVHKGVVFASPALAANGALHVRHIFRYDVSPLLPRLHDEVKRVPVIERNARIRFVDAPRRYHVPLTVHLRYDGTTYEKRATVVLDKQGLKRIDPPLPVGPDPEGLDVARGIDELRLVPQ